MTYPCNKVLITVADLSSTSLNNPYIDAISIC